MFHSLIPFAALLFILHTVFAIPRFATRDNTFTIQTSWIYSNCNDTQKATIEQANKDARDLADKALAPINRELILNADGDAADRKIDFTSRAAIDYWGNPSFSGPYRASIEAAFVGATEYKPGWGVGDWWNNRYVTIVCHKEYVPINDDCDPSTAAFTRNIKANKGLLYPQIHYCPAFFDVLKPHGFLVDKVSADTTGQMKLNTRNLRSQVLHEWLHVKETSAEICGGGCIDTPITIGGATDKAYKPGRVKLLAYNNPSQAAKNNDNFVYFATARWMESKFKVYPEYPHMWDPKLSRVDNEAKEAKEPGYSNAVQSWDVYDKFVDTGESVVEVNKFGPPIQAPPSAAVQRYYPVPENVVCEPSDASPLIDDCVHAFGTLYTTPNIGLLTGSKGGTWWPGYVHSCAIAIYYTGDWSQDPKTGCNAHFEDVLNHAKMIMNACSDHRSGKVGGHIVWDVPNCPAQIEIIHTKGAPPQGLP